MPMSRQLSLPRLRNRVWERGKKSISTADYADNADGGGRTKDFLFAYPSKSASSAVKFPEWIGASKFSTKAAISALIGVPMVKKFMSLLAALAVIGGGATLLAQGEAKAGEGTLSLEDKKY